MCLYSLWIFGLTRFIPNRAHIYGKWIPSKFVYSLACKHWINQPNIQMTNETQIFWERIECITIKYMTTMACILGAFILYIMTLTLESVLFQLIGISRWCCWSSSSSWYLYIYKYMRFQLDKVQYPVQYLIMYNMLRSSVINVTHSQFQLNLRNSFVVQCNALLSFCG